MKKKNKELERVRNQNAVIMSRLEILEKSDENLRLRNKEVELKEFRLENDDVEKI